MTIADFGASVKLSEPVNAGDRLRMTCALQPASENTPDGRVSLRHTIDPGTVALDSVVVTNFTERTAVFAIYAGDGIDGADGNFDLVSNDQPAVDGASRARSSFGHLSPVLESIRAR